MEAMCRSVALIVAALSISDNGSSRGSSLRCYGFAPHVFAAIFGHAQGAQRTRIDLSDRSPRS
jgi:hypothetical protein